LGERSVSPPAGPRFRLRAVERWAPAEGPDGEYPLTLVVGGTLYQAGLGTETAHCETLESLDFGPSVGVSEGDAERLGIAEGDRVAVVSRQGRVEAPARRIARLAPGLVWMAPHYRAAPVYELMDGRLDPDSKTPALKSCPVRLEKMGGA
jgi:anaerobic selenocysteine-containing dehydrogenase